MSAPHDNPWRPVSDDPKEMPEDGNAVECLHSCGQRSTGLWLGNDPDGMAIEGWLIDFTSRITAEDLMKDLGATTHWRPLDKK